MSKLSRSRPRRVSYVTPIRAAKTTLLSSHPPLDEKLPLKKVSSQVVPKNILVDLYRCKQEQGETVSAFAARVNQLASSYPLAKLCDCGCNRLVSYAPETVLHIVLCGLRDKELQSMCLSEAENGRVKSESALIELCTNFKRENQIDGEDNSEKMLSQDGSDKNEATGDEDMEIDMNILSLEEDLPEEKKVGLKEGEENTGMAAETQYTGRNSDNMSYGIAGLFLEVVKDISTVFQEVIQEVDVRYVSGIKDAPLWRPTSPDMFESEEEEGNGNPGDELPSFPRKCPFTLPLSHMLGNKRPEAAEENSKTSPTHGKRKKRAMRKSTIQVSLFL